MTRWLLAGGCGAGQVSMSIGTDHPETGLRAGVTKGLWVRSAPQRGSEGRDSGAGGSCVISMGAAQAQ